MKRVLLSIQVCNFKDCFIGTVKVATTEMMIEPIIKNLISAGIIIRGYTADYLNAEDADPICQASWIIADVIADLTKQADYVKQSPNVDQAVYLTGKPQN